MVVGTVLVVAACGESSGVDEARPSSPADTTAVPETSSPPPVPAGFSLVESFDEIAPAYWLPVEVDGEQVIFERGAHWRLSGSDDAVSLSGYDGCNSFQSVDPTRYEDGTLVETLMVQTLVDCGDDPHTAPTSGDRFFISDDATELLVENESRERVRLQLRDTEPIGNRMTPDEEAAAQARHDAEDQRQRDELEAEMQATRDAVIAELAAAQERWAAAGVTDYQLRFEPACLTCPSFPDVPPSSDRTQTVEVNDGVAAGPWTEASIGATIDDWLSYLDGHLSAGGYATAEFDPDLGYPVDMYVAMARTVHSDAAVSADEFVLRAVVVTPR